MTSAGSYLDLYDYRWPVFALYCKRNEALRNDEHPETMLQWFRDERDRLFAEHPQSPLAEEQKWSFRSLSYFPYNSGACIEATVDPYVEHRRLLVHTSGEETMPMSRAAILRFTIDGQTAELSMYWIEVYGGGLFLPFGDTTAPVATYGGGGATSSTRSRVATSLRYRRRMHCSATQALSHGVPGSTSTTPTIPPAPTTTAGSVRWPRPRTGCRFRSGPARRSFLTRLVRHGCIRFFLTLGLDYRHKRPKSAESFCSGVLDIDALIKLAINTVSRALGINDRRVGELSVFKRPSSRPSGEEVMNS